MTQRTPNHGAARLYRFCLRLLPREFRREFGQEMTAVFLQRLEETPEGWPRTRLRARAYTDLLLEGVGERWRNRRPGDSPVRGPGAPLASSSKPKKERPPMLWDQLRSDLRYTLRTLRRSPVYTGVVVSTLAVGIALNSLVFSVMNPFLLRPLPYADAENLVHLGGVDPISGWEGGRFSFHQITDLRERTRSFEDLAGYFYGTRNLSGDLAAEQISTCWVTGNLFPLLGVQAAIGRALDPADDRLGQPQVALLSRGLWVRRYGGDPGIVGRDIRLDGVPHTVVGVLPADFNFPFNSVEIWLPMRADPAEEDRSDMGTLLIGRLADGWNRDRAREEISQVHQELATAYPEADGRYTGISAVPLREALNFAWEILRTAFLIMLVGVAFVLVIACVNVASLTLARLGTRTREVALRQAMGAGRVRLVRQFLVEAVVLATMGGVLGVGLTRLATGILGGIIPGDLYRVGEISVDGRVVAFTALVTLSTPLFFALAPAWTAARAGLVGALKEGSAGGGVGRVTLRGRRILVVAEVALGMVLVTGTGLMARSLANALATDVGFPAQRILTAQLSLEASLTDDTLAINNRFGTVMEGLRSIPGVAAVGSVSNLPLNHETITVPYSTLDGLDTPVEDRPLALTSRAGPEYFTAMGIPLVAGRTFRPEDGDAGNVGVMVSQSLARRLWPGENAVGRTLAYGRGEEPVTATVLGVVGDVHYDGLVESPRPHLYRPLVGTAGRRRFLVITAAQGTTPQALIEPVRRALFDMHPDLPAGLRPMTDILRESTGLWAISSLFLGIFGLVALALAALGIYGVMAFSVSQRRREMGLRIALGADRGRLVKGVVGEGLRVTAVGLGIGGIGAVATGILLSSLLLGVGPVDLITLLSVSAVFLLVSAGSALIPARRAARVEPVEALRAE